MLSNLKKRLKGGLSADDSPVSSAPAAEAGSGAIASRSAHALHAGPPMAGQVPDADVALPHAVAREKRRPSGVKTATTDPARQALNAALRDSSVLVLMRDAPAAKKEALFRQKLAVCTLTAFDWDSTLKADVEVREVKRKVLVDLMEWIQSPAGSKSLTEGVYEELVAMVATNIFRTFPPSGRTVLGAEEVTGVPGGGGEGDDDEPSLDPAWPHLVLVYEFLLRFVMSSETKVKSAKKFISASFCAQLIDLFESEDPREREYLKTILHRIYGKFMSHRAFVRKAISHVFVRFVYETERHPGIGELLEILGSIVNGFALPLKGEHIVFLEKALLPLFRLRSLAAYLPQLSYCVAQYVDKDRATVVYVLRHLMRYWPASSSSKQVMLLNTMEEILEWSGDAALPALPHVLAIVSRCLNSQHFLIVERALYLWQNEKVGNLGGILSPVNAAALLPTLYPALLKSASGHWNTNVVTLAQFVLKRFREGDPALFERVAAIASSTAAREGSSASASTAASTELGSAASIAGAAVHASNEIAATRAARWRAVEEAAFKAHPELFPEGAPHAAAHGGWKESASPSPIAE